MPVDVVIPDLGESITEAVIASWLRNDGELVATDEPIAELETDKATVELPSPASGVLHVTVAAGTTVAVGDTIARIEAVDASGPRPVAAAKTSAASPPQRSIVPSERAPEETESSEAEPAAQATPAILSPAAKRLVEEHRLDASAIDATGKGGRVTKADVLAHIDQSADAAPAPIAAAVAQTARPTPATTPSPARSAAPTGITPGLALIRSNTTAKAESKAVPSAAMSASASRAMAAPAATFDGPDEERVAMTPLRRTIASRLVGVQQTAAILTTFNEIDMSAVMALRARYKEEFARQHGVSLGFMSFFARACVLACADVRSVNARLDGDEIVYSKRVHLGIAASTPKGLVVPVVKNAESMSLADLEREIARLAGLARDGKLSLDDMSGGTFTISNGGVFGSLMSTPILNPPQSGILGMHKIEKRAVVVDDEIVIRPMMYVALSYDHRLIDGREAVTFLVGVKERIEDPERMLLGV